MPCCSAKTTWGGTRNRSCWRHSGAVVNVRVADRQADRASCEKAAPPPSCARVEPDRKTFAHHRRGAYASARRLAERHDHATIAIVFVPSSVAGSNTTDLTGHLQPASISSDRVRASRRLARRCHGM
jgi:hypothetical protein